MQHSLQFESNFFIYAHAHMHARVASRTLALRGISSSRSVFHLALCSTRATHTHTHPHAICAYFNAHAHRTETGKRSVSEVLFRGEFVMLRGPSGGGKTTFLNMLGTIDTPTKGTIRIFDSIVDANSKDSFLSQLRLEKIGLFHFAQCNACCVTRC